MKAWLSVFLFFIVINLFAQVSIDSIVLQADISAMLDIKSTTRGLLIPRMTESQRDAIVLPAKGLLIFCVDNNQLYCNKGIPSNKNWVMVSGSGTLVWADTLAQLATDYNLTSKQKVSDTNTTDASRYWVKQQNYVTPTTKGTTNTVLHGNALGNPAFGAVNLGSDVTGTLPIANGGTGLVSMSQGDLLYGSAANTVTTLTKDGNASRYLSNTGTANNPAWAQINLTNGVTGILPVGNGGCGVSALGDVTGSSKIAFGGTPLQSVIKPFSIDINEANLTLSNMSGTLGVAHGGTGLSSLASNKVLVGQGTGAILPAANLHWDNTNNWLGIGKIPTTTLDVAGTLNMNGNPITNISTPNNNQDAATKSYVDNAIIVNGLTYIANQTTLQSNANFHIGSNGLIEGTLGIGNGVVTTYPLTVVGDVGWSGTLQTGTVPWARLSNIPNASISTQGIVQLSNSYLGTSQILATTEKAITDGLATKANAAHVHSAADITSGTLVVGRGGTGSSSLTGYIKGNGTSPFTATSSIPGSDITGDIAGNAGNVTGLVAVAHGGTGLNTLSANKVLVGNGTTAILQPANLHWDNTNSRLGILTDSPVATLSVGNISQFQVASTGATTVSLSSPGAAITASNSSGNGITSTSSGIAIIARGYNSPVFDNSPICGAAFKGTIFGVYGEATYSGSGPQYGGYFYTKKSVTESSYCYIGGYTGSTAHTIYGPGYTTLLVPSASGGALEMFGQVSPEMLMTDYGTGSLINGHCHINIDSKFSYNIVSTDEHPIKVFIQLEGDCKGVYVSNKSTTGFDVIELQQGTSNVDFSYTIVANRADLTGSNGSLKSKHVGVRFPSSPIKENLNK